MDQAPAKNGTKSDRDDKGRFTAGNKGGPGRPPAEFSITELLRAEIASRPHVVKRWVDLMESEDENVALRAISAAANRIDGMPKQTSEVDITERKIETVVVADNAPPSLKLVQ